MERNMEEPSAIAAPATEDSASEARRQAARLLGLAKSEVKAQKARENGALGGRPKGKPQSEETKAKIAAAARARAAARKAGQ